MKSVILVLGAGEDQRPVIREANQMGLRTVAVDRNPFSIGFDDCQQYYVVCTRNVAGIKKSLGSTTPSAVVAPASDASQIAAAELRAHYGCPMHVPVAAIEASRDKTYFRKIISELELPTYQFAVLKSPRDAEPALIEIGLPLVIKPVDSSGSKGIQFVQEAGRTFKDAIETAFTYSTSRRVIVERYVHGKHYTAEVFLSEGKVLFAAVMRKIADAVSLHTETLFYPSGLSDEQLDEIYAIADRLCQRLGLNSGPLNIDFVVDPSRGPVLIEIGARLAGNGIPDLVATALGVSLPRYLLNWSLRRPLPIPVTRHMHAALCILRSSKTCDAETIARISKFSSDPAVKLFNLFHSPAARTCDAPEGSKLGYLILAASDQWELAAAYERLCSTTGFQREGAKSSATR